MKVERLIEMAIEARERAYVPYSGFKVGASILTKEGRVFTGCNIESASYSPTICAERTALAKAVSEGYRDLDTVVVVGSFEKLSYPCGVCRQLIREFGEDIKIIVAKNTEEYKKYTIRELLPESFGPEDLENE